MVNLNDGIDKFLVNSKVLINNSLNDEVVKKAVNPFGYDKTKLTNGQNLLITVEGLQQTQKKEYGDQYHVHDAFTRKREQAHGGYKDTVAIARIALRDNVGAQQSLGLNQRRKKSYSGWLEQALNFCNNLLANPAYVTAMSEYGQTAKKLQEVKQTITDTQKLAEKYKSEKGEAQQATKERDTKVDELYQWTADYRKIARIALKDKPQLLEKLGIIEPS